MNEVKEDKKSDVSLKDYGIIYLSGLIDDGAAEKVCTEIIEYNFKDSSDVIQLIINSPGGDVHSGFAIIDIIEWSRLPVYTTGIGRIASMGLLIFMAGDKGNRVITPHTSILSHRFWSLAMGSHSDLIAKRKEEDLLHDRILQHYLTYANIKSKEELEKTLLRDCDTWLNPEEAIKHGIADKVEKSRRNARQ